MNFIRDFIILVAGSGLAILAMVPHIDKQNAEAHGRGYAYGMKVGMLYADELIQDGYACVQSAFHTKQGEQRVGVVCNNGIRSIVLAEKANSL